MYDRRQKKAAQKKWCDLVADVAQQPASTRELPRTLNVILSAPPGDSLGTSQVFFKEYIKPILVAAALEYDLIQGRREGDVRYGVAEQIRRLRRKKGEVGENGAQTEMDGEQMLAVFREQAGINPPPGVRGDVVVGRHTWKEYVRGVHEGWLGPLDPPPDPAAEATPLVHSTSSSEDAPPEKTEQQIRKEEEEKKKVEERKKNDRPAAYIPTSAYASAPLSPHTPSILEPSQPFHQYHLLGFLKTPIRMWNYLNHRKLADECGRQAAAVVLAAYRPYQQDEYFASTSSEELDSSPRLATQAPENDAATVSTSQTFEQESINVQDELTWHKSVRKPKKIDETRERIWMADMVLDPRITSRMRRFQLEPEEEARAARIDRGEEKGRAIPVDDLEKQESIIGNLDDEAA